MVNLDSDMVYGLMIWEMTLSLWLSSISIWDILSLCSRPVRPSPKDNVCSNIDCDQRELLTSQVSVTDTTPPALRTAVLAVVEVPYGETTAFKYTVCASCGDAG
jgi:hypothetical protein